MAHGAGGRMQAREREDRREEPADGSVDAERALCGDKQTGAAAGGDENDPGPRRELRPRGLHDLRIGAGTAVAAGSGEHAEAGAAGAPGAAGAAHDDPVRVLRYGPRDVLVVAGLPGAGKSTLMARCAAAPLVDSRHTRLHYQARLPRWIPYRLFRPVVRVAHLRRMRAGLRGDGPLAVQDFGAVPLVRTWVGWEARRQGRDVHVLFLDVDAATAWHSQVARGRCVPPRRFARHRTLAARVLGRLAASGEPPRGWTSVVVLDRPAADRVRRIDFGEDHERAAG